MSFIGHVSRAAAAAAQRERGDEISTAHWVTFRQRVKRARHRKSDDMQQHRALSCGGCRMTTTTTTKQDENDVRGSGGQSSIGTREPWQRKDGRSDEQNRPDNEAEARKNVMFSSHQLWKKLAPSVEPRCTDQADVFRGSKCAD
jgi:hypothetical protein